MMNIVTYCEYRVGLSFALIIMMIQQSMGQSMSTITIKQDSVYIGDIVEATILVKVPQSVGIVGVNFALFDKIENKLYFRDTTSYEALADAEILDFGSWSSESKQQIVPVSRISTVKENGFIIFENRIRFSIYNQGRFEIPGVNIIKIDSTSDSTIEVQKPVLVVLLPERITQSDSLAINPIKDIISEPKNWRDYLWLLWIVPIVGFSLWAYRTWRQRKTYSSTETMELQNSTATEIALAGIDKLRQSKLWLDGREKQYQTELTDIIRNYIKDELKVPATVQTTPQILAMMGGRLSSTELENLNDILNMADLVKFAKVEAGIDINESFLSRSTSFVLNTYVR